VKNIDISIIIPCRNEEAHIKRTIECVLTQKGAGKQFSYELILIDGQSDDNTAAVIREVMRDKPTIQLIINEKKITPVAFNLGIKRAQGKFICILGAHVEIEDDYMLNCLETINTIDADNVGGPWRARGEGYIGEAIALAFQSPFAVGGAKGHDLNYEGYLDTVWGGFYRREIFEKIGLFDEDLIRNQDDELNHRLVKIGGKIWQSPKIRYYYLCRSSLKALFHQYFQYGYWKVRVIRKHKIPASVRHVIPGSFILILVSLLLLSFFFHWAFLVLLFVVLLYLLLNIFMSFMTGLQQKRVVFLPVLPFIFLIFHFGYGLGFLMGIIHFVLSGHRNGKPVFEQITRS
jgi:succinoglycan biosynthesis protein ExoA